MRELKAQWMINGPGGYVNHYLTLKVPSWYEVLLAVSLVVLLWEVWSLWTHHR